MKNIQNADGLGEFSIAECRLPLERLRASADRIEHRQLAIGIEILSS